MIDIPPISDNSAIIMMLISLAAGFVFGYALGLAKREAKKPKED